MTARHLVLIATVAALVAALAAFVGTGSRSAAQAPAAAASPLVVGAPVAARPAGRPPRATAALRARDPQTGRAVLVTVGAVDRADAPPRHRRLVCLDVVVAAAARDRRFAAEGGCRPRTGAFAGAVLVTSTRGGPGTATQLTGFAPAGTRRMTVAGAGPTVDLPLGRERAWLVLLADGLRTTLTLTAELADGTTRFERVRIPLGPVPAGAPETEDPVDDTTWAVQASTRRGGHRAGQTCVQFFQLGPEGRERGFGPPMCGDLRREPLFADALERGPGPRTTFGGGPDVPRRLIVWGAASGRVRGLELDAPGGRRPLPLTATARGFIAVLPPGVRPGDVTLHATLADGTTRAWRAPRRVGVAPQTRVPLRRTEPLRARLDERRRRVVLTLGVTGSPDRVVVNVRHHRVVLAPVSGQAGRYAAALPVPRGRERSYARGRLLAAQTVLCAPGCVARDEDVVLR